MQVDIRYDFGCKLVRGNLGKYRHSFGGNFRYGGTVPEGCAFPVHLLFRLDLVDPVVPFTMNNDIQFLPLFFAFSYDASPLSYQVLSNEEIKILELENTEYLPDCPYRNYPLFFDLVPIKTEPITYEEQRELVMAAFAFNYPELHSAFPSGEWQRLRRLHYLFARVGRVHDLLQDPRCEPCPNWQCENHATKFCCMNTIVTIPERPFPDLDLWQADGPTIQIVYEICTLCGCIRTYYNFD